MRHRIRTVRTGSGTTAVQLVRYEGRTTHIIKHIGSAKSVEETEILRTEAERHIAEHTSQLSLFEEDPIRRIVAFNAIEAIEVSHGFAREVLLTVAGQCGLQPLDILFRDLAVMRIIEPCSKKRSLELIKQYFGITYSLYVYGNPPIFNSTF